MANVYFNQQDYWKLHEMGIYEWEVMVSIDFSSGYDESFKVRATVRELLDNVVNFMTSHLKEETVLISVYNENNQKEIEAVVTNDVIIYLNGLGEFVKGKPDLGKY